MFGSPEPRMKTEPHDHQLQEYFEHTDNKARALFWYMRTGKSKAIIDQACKLYLDGKIQTLLIVAPNGVHENWIDNEIPKHMWDMVPYTTWTWNTVAKSQPQHVHDFHTTCAVKQLRIFSFPSSTLIHPIAKKMLAGAISTSKGKVLVTFDEAHDFRTPGSKRTKWARAFSKRCDYRRILTGTPDFNSLLHYYSQLELLTPKAMGWNGITEFKKRYAEYEMTNMGYPRLMGYKNIPELKERMMKYATVIRREDCPWLSAINPSQVEIIVTDRQKKAQQVLNAKLKEKIQDIPEDDTFAIIGEIQRSWIKHQQIVSGFIGGRDPETNVYKIHEIIPPVDNPRIQRLLKEINYTTDQVIVWCQFRYDIHTIMNVLQQNDISCAAYFGETSAKLKKITRTQFNDGKIRVFVGQPQSAGLGLDLSASSKIIWYSHTYDAIVRSQANERATSVDNAFIDLIDFWAKPIDKIMLEALETKVNISDYIANTDVEDLLGELEVTFR